MVSASVFAEHAFRYEAPGDLLQPSFFAHGVEKQVVDIVRYAVDEGRAASSERYTVADIGMNTGYFSLLAAARGARVLAFEPQPTCVALMRAALEKPENAALRPLVTVTNVAVGPRSTLNVPSTWCSGGYQGLSHDAPITHNVLVLPLRSLLNSRQRIRLVKIDTEGAEIPVLDDLTYLVRRRLVDHIVVEVLPRNWEGRGTTFEHGTAVLEAIAKEAAHVFLLEDAGYQFPVNKAVLPAGASISGTVLSDFKMADLVANRKQTGGGCNIWFIFPVAAVS